jgi:hypothetical protein
MKQLPVSLNEKQFEFLNAQSQVRGVSKASILRNLLADYMEAKQ